MTELEKKKKIREKCYGQDLTERCNEESLQTAKDFLWRHIDTNNKALLLHMTSGDLLEKNNLSVRNITIAYEYNR